MLIQQFTESVLRRRQINQFKTFLKNGTDYKVNIKIQSHFVGSMKQIRSVTQCNTGVKKWCNLFSLFIALFINEHKWTYSDITNIKEKYVLWLVYVHWKSFSHFPFPISKILCYKKLPFNLLNNPAIFIYGLFHVTRTKKNDKCTQMMIRKLHFFTCIMLKHEIAVITLYMYVGCSF